MSTEQTQHVQTALDKLIEARRIANAILADEMPEHVRWLRVGVLCAAVQLASDEMVRAARHDE